MAVVTGGSSGIGALAAASLAKAGARVLVCGRRENLLEQATAFAVGAGDRLEPLRIDLSQPDAPMKVAEASEKELGGCDILVCNAGILALSDQPSIDTNALAEHFQFNVTVHAECANAFLPQLRRSECARVINVASIYGLVGPIRSGLAPYVTSKHALVGLTRAQSVQWVT